MDTINTIQGVSRTYLPLFGIRSTSFIWFQTQAAAWRDFLGQTKSSFFFITIAHKLRKWNAPFKFHGLQWNSRRYYSTNYIKIN